MANDQAVFSTDIAAWQKASQRETGAASEQDFA